MTRPTQTGSSRRRRRSASEINIDWKPFNLPKMPYLYLTGGQDHKYPVHRNKTVQINHVQKVRVVRIHSNHVQIIHVQGAGLQTTTNIMSSTRLSIWHFGRRCALDGDLCDYILYNKARGLYDQVLEFIDTLPRKKLKVINKNEGGFSKVAVRKPLAVRPCYRKKVLDWGGGSTVLGNSHVHGQKTAEKNALIFVGASNSGKTLMMTGPLCDLARFVGRVTNTNASSSFGWRVCVNVRIISMKHWSLAMLLRNSRMSLVVNPFPQCSETLGFFKNFFFGVTEEHEGRAEVDVKVVAGQRTPWNFPALQLLLAVITLVVAVFVLLPLLLLY